MIGCRCKVCLSSDPRDKRLRPSVLLRFGVQRVLIDTAPDFRYQALRFQIDRLDAILYTHSHADHILGLDDVRPFNFMQKTDIPIYASAEALVTIRRTFQYVFGDCAYLTDHSEIPSASLEMLSGLDVLFLDALRHNPHPTHSTVEESLRTVEMLKPKRAFFTHISHDLMHATLAARLPEHVHLAYDGLEIPIGRCGA